MAQVIRMTESDLHNMISEAVMRIINEGEGLNAFIKGFNATGLANYAASRLWNGESQHKLGEKSDEAKEKEYYTNHMKYGQTYGNNDSFEEYKEKTKAAANADKNTSSNTNATTDTNTTV